MKPSDLVDLVLALLSIVATLLALIGLGVRFALLPWLRQHLVEPVKETNRQVTVNGHVSPVPTLLDKVDRLATDVETVRGDVAAGARMYEGHIDRSSAEWGHVWDALNHLRRHTDAPPFPRKRHHD